MFVLIQCNFKLCVFFWAFVKHESYFMYLFRVKELDFFGVLVGYFLSIDLFFKLLINDLISI
jgi:hypothetical protein